MAESTDETLFPLIQCNSCTKQFKGQHYSCLVCYQYDLCNDCFKEANHPHPMQCTIHSKTILESTFGKEETKQLFSKNIFHNAFNCGFCNKQELGKTDLINHIFSEHGKCEETRFCPICITALEKPRTAATTSHLDATHKNGIQLNDVSFIDGLDILDDAIFLTTLDHSLAGRNYNYHLESKVPNDAPNRSSNFTPKESIEKSPLETSLVFSEKLEESNNMMLGSGLNLNEKVEVISSQPGKISSDMVNFKYPVANQHSDFIPINIGGDQLNHEGVSDLLLKDNGNIIGSQFDHQDGVNNNDCDCCDGDCCDGDCCDGCDCDGSCCEVAVGCGECISVCFICCSE